MGNGIFTACSGAKNQFTYLDIIANNLANINTTGYKADDLHFGDYMVNAEDGFRGGPLLDSENAMATLNFDERQQIYNKILGQRINFTQGSIKETGSRLDLAIQGDGFFQVELNGKTYFTRDGHFTMNENEELVNASGGKLLDDSGSILKVEGSEGIKVDETGGVFRNGNEVGRIGLKTLPDLKSVAKASGQLFEYKNDNMPPEDAKATIAQGYLESSNVNPIEEMTKMIRVNRHYDSLDRVIRAYRELDSKSITDVGEAR